MLKQTSKKYEMEGVSKEYTEDELMLIACYRMADKKIKQYIFELVRLLTKDPS